MSTVTSSASTEDSERRTSGSVLSIFKNIRIGNRLLLAMALPVIGLLVYAGIVMTDRFGEQQEMQSLNQLANLAPTVSALVHEMQKERGASAGFIASKGKKFADTLPTQRRDTDGKRQGLLTALDAFDTAAYGQGLVEKVNQAHQAVNGLDAMRGQVSSLAATVPQMAGYYTSTIAKLLGIVEGMTEASNNDAVSKAITAYIAFLQAKERAGIERAMGAGGFGGGEFKPAIYRKFLQLIAAQKRALWRRIAATMDEIAFHERAMRCKTDLQVLKRVRAGAAGRAVVPVAAGVCGLRADPVVGASPR